MKNALLRIVVFIILCTAFAGSFFLFGFVARQFFGVHLHLSGIAFELFLLICVFSALLLMTKFADKRPLSDFGMTPVCIAPEGLMGLVGGFGVVVLNIAISYFAGWFRPLGQNPDFAPDQVFVFPLFIALVEEIAFRGYIFANLLRRYGAVVALVVSSVLFGALHFANPDGLTTVAKLLNILSITSAGFVLGAAFLLTRRLWLSVGLHWGYDTAIYLLDNESGIALFRTRQTHQFASEAVTLFLNIVVGSVLLWITVRRGNLQRGDKTIIPVL